MKRGSRLLRRQHVRGALMRRRPDEKGIKTQGFRVAILRADDETQTR